MFSFLKKLIPDSDTYLMKPEPPPIKWIIDIVPCKIDTKSGVEEYIVKRLDPNWKFPHYDIIAFFKTAEEAEAFVAKHFHFPVGYRYPPTVFEDLETK